MKETQPKKNKFVKVILLLLIISIVINIKLSIDNKNTQEIKNDKQYYNLRNQANKQILNGDYELAINTYKKIKENFPLKDNFDSSIKLILNQKNRSNEYDSLKEKTNTYIKDIKNLESENIIINNHYKKLLQDFNTKNNKLTFNKTTSNTPPFKKTRY
ncbi:hypothetical protein H9W90_09315 [Polaribacter pectinis]|uniref:Tetratricopeptide repeat-containing protein n=1 Tax=Polaribacter pectinis TaxID=2738844 RepID=A0A7G9L705_9FLAO|nr:hypothetical protein [Polaribacter pectinis]QNM84404.1 hypothetical protein H9W90_09315 [Polaribacter pectinis]